MHKAEGVRESRFLGIANVRGKNKYFVHKSHEDAKRANSNDLHVEFFRSICQPEEN